MTRFGFVITTYAATLFVALTSVFHPAPKLLWNASASVPIGLYAVRRAPPLHVGELVVVTPPDAARAVLRGAPLPAARRAAGEARPRASRPDRLPYRTRHHRRWRRHGRGARTRPPRPRSARLAGLPRARAGEVFLMNTRAAGLPRRPVFRAAATHHHRRPGRSDLDARGELTMPRPSSRSAAVESVQGLRLFLLPGHRRASRSPFRLTSTHAAFAAICMSRSWWCCCRRAASPTRSPAPPRNQPSTSKSDRFAAVRRGSRAALRHSGVLDHGRHAGGKSRCRARRLAQGRDGADADHAATPGPACGRATASAPIHSIRTTTFSRARRICASCTIATARPASSRPTMPVLDATRIILRAAVRCRRRRKPTSPRSHRCCATMDRRRATSSPRSSAPGPVRRCFRCARTTPQAQAPASSGDLGKRRSVARPATDWTGLAPQSEGLFAPLSAREPRL